MHGRVGEGERMGKREERRGLAIGQGREKERGSERGKEGVRRVGERREDRRTQIKEVGS